MSANFTKIVNTIRKNTKTENNVNAYPLTAIVDDVNSTLDDVFALIFHNSGTWQFDDTNNTDYPIITTNLTSGQRDYPFTSDENGNLILDIFKVLVANPSGTYTEVFPIDIDQNAGTQAFYNGLNTGGQPWRYGKIANGIFFDAVPNYSYAQGIKMYINREASYFTVSDTTKKPGFAGLFHEYLALRPSYEYAYRNSLPNVNVLKAEMQEMRDSIETYYSNRSRDEKQQIIPVYRSAR